MSRAWLWSWLFVGACAAAEDVPPTPAVTVPWRGADITIDGNVDDEGWRGAAVATLAARALNAGEIDLPDHNVGRTEARLAYDADFLYVAFVCADGGAHPYGEKRDDELYRGDVVEVFIDGVGDARQFFELQVNPRGALCDINHLFTGPDAAVDPYGLYTRGAEQWSLIEYDLPDVRHAATVTRDADGRVTGWQAELAIPARELLRRRGERQLRAGHAFHANFLRLDYPDGAERAMRCVFWSPTMYGRPHRSPGRMGRLLLGAAGAEDGAH